MPRFAETCDTMGARLGNLAVAYFLASLFLVETHKIGSKIENSVFFY